MCTFSSFLLPPIPPSLPLFSLFFSPSQDSDKAIVEYTVLKCQGKREKIWIYLVFGGIVLTQLLAVFFAVRTRKVHIRALNDSKYMAVVIYLTTMILIVMIVSVITLENFINADAAVFAGGVMIFTTLVLTLTFIPKVHVCVYVYFRCRENGSKAMHAADIRKGFHT